MAIKYTLVRSSNSQELVDAVNKLIGEGWVPQGGVAVRPSTEYSDAIFIQALIKEVPNGN